jgi:hypothetical protein
MTQSHPVRLGLAVIPVLALMNSCGGGGSGGSAPAAPTWIKGQFAAESTFAASCVTPRTGNDALTGKPYPDRQGKLLDELNWLRSWTNDLYLWYSEVADQNPAGFAILASALSYRQNAVCPVPPSGFAAPPTLAAGAYVPPMADGQAIKSLWQQNRIQRRSSAQ